VEPPAALLTANAAFDRSLYIFLRDEHHLPVLAPRPFQLELVVIYARGIPSHAWYVKVSLIVLGATT